MNRKLISSAVAVLAVVSALGRSSGGPSRAQAQPTGAMPRAADQQARQAANDAFVQRIAKQIAGREQEPASAVFKDIQLDFFKRTPAGLFLEIMNAGYAAALGVECTHCHAAEDFSKNDKRPKRAAREMAAMHFSINQQLANMQNLQPNPQGHFINCSTCHRGKINPLAEE